MNRREFNTALMSGAAITALPTSALSTPARAAARGPMVAWATAIARAQNRASPALLARQLKIPMDAAQGLYATLIQDGIVKTPLAGGVAKASDPIRLTLNTSPAPTASARLQSARSKPSSCQKTLGAAETEKSSQDFSHRADEGCAKPDRANGPANIATDASETLDGQRDALTATNTHGD